MDDHKPALPKIVQHLKEQRHQHKQRPKAIRALYAMVGATIFLAGLAMVILPGPAFVVIPIGLAILALEFTWAERMLEKAVEKGEQAKRKAQQATPLQKRLTFIAAFFAIAAVSAWGYFGDIPYLPV